MINDFLISEWKFPKAMSHGNGFNAVSLATEKDMV